MYLLVSSFAWQLMGSISKRYDPEIFHLKSFSDVLFTKMRLCNSFLGGWKTVELSFQNSEVIYFKPRILYLVILKVKCEDKTFQEATEWCASIKASKWKRNIWIPRWWLDIPQETALWFSRTIVKGNCQKEEVTQRVLRAMSPEEHLRKCIQLIYYQVFKTIIYETLMKTGKNLDDLDLAMISWM